MDQGMIFDVVEAKCLNLLLINASAFKYKKLLNYQFKSEK